MASNILKATVTIKGIRPLLWHRFGPDALPLEKQERTGVAGNDPEEWKRTVLMTAERQLYVEASQVFGMMRDAAKYTKKGKGSIQGLVAATLQIDDDRVLIDRFVPGGDAPPTDPTQPVYLDIRGVRNPSTKARNVRYRVAASSGWSTAFHLVWDKTVVSRNEIEAVLRDAGQLVGIGNGRSIGMGRFKVEAFEVTES
jgi:hypothetical protein